MDFINRYRVQEVQAKLVDSKFDHYTILGIAQEAGFNAKSTFYTAFKKVTGMTPSAYRKQRANA
ncbi:MAG: helix-turn-helix domain-containing protein [Bacteroidota bacterium]